MIHSILTAMQQPWYVFMVIAMSGYLVGLLFDNKDVRDNWFAAGIVFSILSVCWPITLGFLLGSLVQRWLK